MFITAAWALEQEYKAAKWFVEAGGLERSPGPMTRTEAFALGFGGTGLFMAHSAIAVQPYMQIARLAENLDIVVRQRSKKHMGIRFLASGSGRGYIARFAPRAGRMLVTRGLSRAVPYVGWALLAVDLWYLGKWIGEKTSPV